MQDGRHRWPIIVESMQTLPLLHGHSGGKPGESAAGAGLAVADAFAVGAGVAVAAGTGTGGATGAGGAGAHAASTTLTASGAVARIRQGYPKPPAGLSRSRRGGWGEST